jgi:1,5-anhydro-D-fructose reductase (1,5-anhydro-D-mannitol-forming)
MAIRYGILGFGLHGVRRLAPSFKATRQSTLAGIWRRNAAKAQDNARELSIPQVFPSAEALCASPDIDAVFVTSPDSLHCAHSLLALEHGKHVLCEKPLAMNLAEAERMLAAARSANLRFGAAQNFRYNASSARVREWIQAGRIGKPFLAHCQFTFDAKTSARQWIYEPSLALGGPIGDIGSHCIDLLRFLLDDQVTQVATVAEHDAASGPLEAGAAISLAFKRGTFAAVTVSFRGAYRTAFEISGETGQIIAEDGLSSERPVRVTLLRNGRIEAVEEIPNEGSYSRMLDGFSTWVQGGAEYLSPGQDAVEMQRVLDAAYASAKQGERFRL